MQPVLLLFATGAPRWRYQLPATDHHLDACGVLLEPGKAAELAWDIRPTSPLICAHVPQRQVYVEYTDASFTTPKFKAGSRGLLGPTLKVEVGQILEIVFQVRSHGRLLTRRHQRRHQSSRCCARLSGVLFKGLCCRRAADKAAKPTLVADLCVSKPPSQNRLPFEVNLMLDGGLELLSAVDDKNAR